MDSYTNHLKQCNEEPNNVNREWYSLLCCT